jgi:regulator of protease activity HflC (stomatin/prohibitin superfamily)
MSTIQPGNQGLMWRPWGAGLEKDKVYQDGIVWHWPWNDVIEYEVQWRNYQEMISILTFDDLHMDVTLSVVLRPNPDQLYALAQEVGGEYYARLVRPEFYTITRNVMAKYIHNKLPENSPKIENEILAALKEHLMGKHINFDNVTLDHIMYSPLVTEASDRKLATQQILEQKVFESGIAEKDAEIQRIKAKGQRDAQKIIDEGLTKKYLQFKSLEVQEALSKSSNSKFFFVPLGEDGLPVIINTDEK